MIRPQRLAALCGILASIAFTPDLPAEDWPQFKFDSRHSGDVPGCDVTLPLRLAAVAPLTDAIFTAPCVGRGKVYVVDGAGVAFGLDATTLAEKWRFASPAARGERAARSPAGTTQCNNISSPALVDGFLHFGTMAGYYHVLDADSGAEVRRIDCGEPIFSAPIITPRGVYFATLGSRVYALSPQGDVRWTWDFVRSVLEFPGDRWSGADWARHRQAASWREQFLCARDLAGFGETIVLPAGGTVVWLEDRGEGAQPLAFYRGERESPATLGLAIGPDGEVLRQWHRRDNNGSVEVLARQGDVITPRHLRGTETGWKGDGLIGFSSVSVRGKAAYRTRPQEGFGLCRHTLEERADPLASPPAIAAPILLARHALVGTLDGRLLVADLDGKEPVWEFRTPFGKAISAPVAVAGGRVYFGCEDGYVYALAPGGDAPLPGRQLDLERIRAPLSGGHTDARWDWFTNFGDFANTNSRFQDLAPPFRVQWIRRFEGTVKHMSVFGAGRMYTHTAEGQIFAVEQESGRLLWRRHSPGVHVSFTAPLYHGGRLYVPQAGLEKSRLRALDAATGEIIWEAPFTGSPSWNRQLPPIVHEGLVIYLFSSGKFSAEEWLFEHQSTFGFPRSHAPIVRAFDAKTGEVVWSRDFSEYGSGGDDAGMCLLDGTLYYSCYFGGKGPLGVTAALDPVSGEVRWVTTKHTVHAGCTVSGRDGKIYLGGYNPVEDDRNYVWCLDAATGELSWRSAPVSRAIHVITLGSKWLFTHSQYEQAYLLGKDDGDVIATLMKGYNCTRFTLSEPYMLGPNMEVFDMSDNARLISSGPAVDVLQCVGAIPSNGRIYYTTNGGGIQLGMLCGKEAETAP